MSLLPSNTFANPLTPFYGVGGGGGGLQSPVDVIPDGTGEALVNVISTSGALAAIQIGDGAQAGQSSLLKMVSGGGGSNTVQLGQAELVTTGFSGVLNVQNTITNQSCLSVDTIQNVVDIGSALRTAGATNLALVNVPMNVTNGTNAISLVATNGTSSNIGQTVASAGSLILGSSVASPSTLTVSDAGAGTGQVAVGGNAGSSITMTGGVSGSQTSIITTNSTGFGSLLLGASAACDRAIFINDVGGGADTAVVDITRGTASGTALRLQGYGASGTAAQVSTNAGVGGGGVLNLTSAINNPVPAISINDTAIRLELPTTVYSAPNAGVGYGGITQQIINSGGNLDQLPWNITNPSAVGFYNILVRVGDNAAVSINGQINTTGYWNGTIWVAGGIGYSPPIGTGNLLIWFGSTATSRAHLILQNTGSAVLSQVAVYMIPMLSGSVPIMT
jgi:hypothetical protein